MKFKSLSSALFFFISTSTFAQKVEFGIHSGIANYTGDVAQHMILSETKLAGGIFHTHHHLADARLEILTAQAVKIGLPTLYLQQILICETTEMALIKLRQWDQELNQNWVKQIYQLIADTIDFRSQRYIYEHTAKSIQVGSVLFDRDRQILVWSQQGELLTQKILPN